MLLLDLFRRFLGTCRVGEWEPVEKRALALRGRFLHSCFALFVRGHFRAVWGVNNGRVCIRFFFACGTRRNVGYDDVI